MSNSAQAQNAEAEAASTYVEPESLFAQCTAAIGARANVRLLRWDFLDDRARRLALATTDAERAALALPRRQDLERDHPAAFYSLDELQALPRGNKAFAGGPLPLVAVSYCWRSAAHPDPFGQAPPPCGTRSVTVRSGTTLFFPRPWPSSSTGARSTKKMRKATGRTRSAHPSKARLRPCSYGMPISSPPSS